MSPEERQMLTGLFDRIRGAAATPRDPEAEALISDAVRNMPYAPYLLAQAVIVQDQALQAANGKLQEQEGRLRELEQQIEQQQPRQPAGSGGFLGGLGSIFGSGNARPASEPPPSSVPSGGPWGQQAQQSSYGQPYAPPPPAGNPWAGAPGMGGGMGGPGMGGPGMGAPMGGGGSFLHGALGAAAGVAGGVLLADSIRGLFGAHNNPLGIGSGMAGSGGGLGGLGSGLGTGTGGGETIVNNYYDKSADNAQDEKDDTQDASYDDDDNDDGDDSGDDETYDV